MGWHPHFEVHDELDDGRARVTPVGELDMATVPELETVTRAALAKGVGELMIDLSELSFMDSSGLRFLIALHDEACEDGWTLRLLRPAEGPEALFRLTGLDEHLPLSMEPS